MQISACNRPNLERYYVAAAFVALSTVTRVRTKESEFISILSLFYFLFYLARV
jgi:hypothetical protein